MPLEVVVGAVIGAAATSPNVRKAVRKSLVFGVGSVLAAYDKMTAVAHGVVDGARKGAAARGQRPTGNHHCGGGPLEWSTPGHLVRRNAPASGELPLRKRRAQMSQLTDHSSMQAQSDSANGTARVHSNGPAPSTNGAGVPPPTDPADGREVKDRAEEIVDQIAERVASGAQVLTQNVLRFGARTVRPPRIFGPRSRISAGANDPDPTSWHPPFAPRTKAASRCQPALRWSRAGCCIPAGVACAYICLVGRGPRGSDTSKRSCAPCPE